MGLDPNKLSYFYGGLDQKLVGVRGRSRSSRSSKPGAGVLWMDARIRSGAGFRSGGPQYEMGGSAAHPGRCRKVSRNVGASKDPCRDHPGQGPLGLTTARQPDPDDCGAAGRLRNRAAPIMAASRHFPLGASRHVPPRILGSSPTAPPCLAADPWVVYEGKDGVGKGKHIVLISGDEEYRSEEALPQLGKILATHHGFKCTVLFAIDPATGFINPNVNNNIPGLEALKSADLMLIFTRFRNLPSDQMKHIDDYLNAGKPVIGLRTATHAFSNPGSKDYVKYHWQSKDPVWKEGFGRYVLGETWVAHHGGHGSQATRGICQRSGKQSNSRIKDATSSARRTSTPSVFRSRQTPRLSSMARSWKE